MTTLTMHEIRRPRLHDRSKVESRGLVHMSNFRTGKGVSVASLDIRPWQGHTASPRSTFINALCLIGAILIDDSALIPPMIKVQLVCDDRLCSATLIHIPECLRPNLDVIDHPLKLRVQYPSLRGFWYLFSPPIVFSWFAIGNHSAR